MNEEEKFKENYDIGGTVPWGYLPRGNSLRAKFLWYNFLVTFIVTLPIYLLINLFYFKFLVTNEFFLIFN